MRKTLPLLAVVLSVSGVPVRGQRTPADGTVATDSSRRPPNPRDPIGLILEALKSRTIVGFSDPHGFPELKAFELSVVRDPRIRAAIDDIVIENGNARFQPIMDRYIRGEVVPYEELRHVWHDTTQTQTLGPRDGEIPELYRVLRDLNTTGRPGRQIRVLLGDPPIDWSAVHNADDQRRWIEQRDIHAAAVIRKEVVARGHHALVVYGQGHLQRRQQQANYSTEGLAATVASGIESAAPGQLFTLWWLTDRLTPPTDVTNWPIPSAAMLHGTTWGGMDFTAFEDSPARAAIIDGKIVPLPRDQWRTMRMEDQFDAVLYLGKTRGPVPAGELPSAVCADREWVSEWLRRLQFGPTLPTAPRLKQLCGL